jgi:hypothetical protein
MKYFIDTEFIEGFHKPLFGKRRHFIDLISIGIYCEDRREYYAISNEFSYNKADDWVKKNVLKPIEGELYLKHYVAGDGINGKWDLNKQQEWMFKKYGKSNKQIASEIREFCKSGHIRIDEKAPNNIWAGGQLITRSEPEFYAYYADYDWVVFCSLFGRMIDLPKGFPMYCKDLKQMLDEFALSDEGQMLACVGEPAMEVYDDIKKVPLELALQQIKRQRLKKYPKQENEHNALADAKWNYELYKFLQP